eukprot:5629945-Prymnesium_polylepis.1
MRLFVDVFVYSCMAARDRDMPATRVEIRSSSSTIQPEELWRCGRRSVDRPTQAELRPSFVSGHMGMCGCPIWDLLCVSAP